MSDAEHETMQDDDIEITDIPGVQPTKAWTWGVGAPPRSSRSRSPLQPRFTLRQRYIQLIITSGFIVLALLFILGSITPLRDAVALHLFGPTPTPTATLPPGDDLFYIQTVPFWSRILLDGQSIKLPRIGTDPPLYLSRGLHQLSWSAEPFQPIDCTFSVPPHIFQDTCDYGTAQSSDTHTWIISFLPSLTYLSTPQRASLITVAQAALDSLALSETVQPGEQYVYYPFVGDVSGLSTAVSAMNTATQPLWATLRFHLDINNTDNTTCATSDNLCHLQRQNCRLFCTPSDTLNLVAGQPPTDSNAFQVRSWNVLAVTYSTWDYATTDGHVVYSAPLNVPQDQNGTTVEHLLILHITWDNSTNRGDPDWHVTIPLTTLTGLPVISALACADAQDSTNLGYYSVVGAHATPTDWRFSTLPDSAAGCLAVATPQQDASSSEPTLTVAYCLHRFGLFLALNAAAHRYWPSMPLANTYEQHIAQVLGWNPSSRGLS